MSSDVVQWISCELSKLLGTDADDAVARHNTYFLFNVFVSRYNLPGNLPSEAAPGKTDACPVLDSDHSRSCSR